VLPTPIDMELDKKHPWKVLYRDCSFRFDLLTNMAATGNFVLDWSISKTAWPKTAIFVNGSKWNEQFP
jgi:hypothetical protein